MASVSLSKEDDDNNADLDLPLPSSTVIVDPHNVPGHGTSPLTMDTNLGQENDEVVDMTMTPTLAEDSKMPPDSAGATARDETPQQQQQQQEEARVRQLARDTFRYVEHSEVTQTRVKLFGKAFPPNDEDTHDPWHDWTHNHYLAQDMKPADAQVFFTSYDYDSSDANIRALLGWSSQPDDQSRVDDDSSSDASSPCWLKIPKPLPFAGAAPEISSADEIVREFFLHLLENFPESFPDCGEDDLDAMIPLLTNEHLAQLPDGHDKSPELERFVLAAFQYTSLSGKKVLVSAYEKLHQYKVGTMSELLVGFGHVRMVRVTGKDKEGNEKKMIVNGPLFEVPCELSFHQGENARLEIRPAKDADVTLNADVMSALNAVGGDNEELMDNLMALQRKLTVCSLRLDNSQSYRDLLEAAAMLRCRGEVRLCTDARVHMSPTDPEALLITDALCLFARKKASTSFSRDARNLIEALDRNELEITEPLRALVLGPGYLDRRAEERNVSATLSVSDLVSALPASERQREVVCKLLIEGEPVCTLQGPPGTGKTHASVNMSLTATSAGMSVLVTSPNSRTLTAFWEKLPSKLRALTLNVACCEEGDVGKLRKAIEDLIYKLHDIRPNKGNLLRLKQQLDQRKSDLKAAIEHVTTMSERKRRLFDLHGFGNVVTMTTDLMACAPWLMRAVVQEETAEFNVCKIHEWIGELDNLGYGSDAISLGQDILHSDDAELRKLVMEKKTSGQVSKFRPLSAKSEIEKKLDSIKVDGRIPECNQDWDRIERVLMLRIEVFSVLVKHGCPQKALAEENWSALLEVIENGRRLQLALEDNDDALACLRSALEDDASYGRKMQAKCRTLALEVQEIEAEYVFEKISVCLKERLDSKAMSVLEQLLDGLENHGEALNPSQKTKSSGNGRSGRHYQEFQKLFREATKYFPLVVMNTKQASELIPATHSFDLGIMDETSQSDCTAINIMARCKHFVAVGDDKQVSPSQVGLGEDRMRWLETKLPAIPTKRKLLPESSFFALMKSTFPKHSVAMFLHFRCDPRIIAISNELYYVDRLVPLRLASESDSIEDVFLRDGKRNKITKDNTTEAEYISDQICQYIRDHAEEEDADVETIGVISLGGHDQCETIRKMIEAKSEELYQDFGEEIVARHKILIGTPQQFQGDERGICFLSTVVAPKKTAQLPKETSGAAEKSWNVALTRAKNKMILVRSFGIRHLKVEDIRHPILPKFMGLGKEKKEDKPYLNGSSPWMWKAETDLSDFLKRQGYTVRKQGGPIWSNALCVNSRALILIENGGEPEWDRAYNEQQSLESAGRACLRVDYLTLAIKFVAACQDVEAFLKESRVQPTAGAVSAATASTNNNKRTMGNDAAAAAASCSIKRSRKE